MTQITAELFAVQERLASGEAYFFLAIVHKPYDANANAQYRSFIRPQRLYPLSDGINQLLVAVGCGERLLSVVAHDAIESRSSHFARTYIHGNADDLRIVA